MCERLALKESIQLLYEQITGQRAHSGEAALREASEACRSVMDALDRARNTISTLLRFVGQEIDRADTAGCNGCGWKLDVGYTLNTIDRHAVCYQNTAGALCAADWRGPNPPVCGF